MSCFRIGCLGCLRRKTRGQLRIFLFDRPGLFRDQLLDVLAFFFTTAFFFFDTFRLASCVFKPFCFSEPFCSQFLFG